MSIVPVTNVQIMIYAATFKHLFLNNAHCYSFQFYRDLQKQRIQTMLEGIPVGRKKSWVPMQTGEDLYMQSLLNVCMANFDDTPTPMHALVVKFGSLR